MSARMLELDRTKAEQFAGRVMDVLNAGATALMMSIGHRTGLFDTMAKLPPSTSQEIADAAGLNERYVREWLAAMLTSRFVEYDPAARTYALPPEHAASLTRAAAADNLAVFAQYIPLLASVEDPIVECFRAGGGVPYSAYKRFHEIMAEDSGQSLLPVLIDRTLPMIDGLVERLRRGGRVLDIGCGSGRALNLMAATFPHSSFVGYDISAEGIDRGRAEAAERGLSNIRFEVRDVACIEERREFDLITAFDVIHDQARPAVVVEGVARALKDDGVFLMQDIRASSHVHENVDHPIGPFLYTVSCMACMAVSLAENGEGLGTMWGEQKALEMLRAAGFSRIDIRRIDGDMQNQYYICRKG